MTKASEQPEQVIDGETSRAQREGRIDKNIANLEFEISVLEEKEKELQKKGEDLSPEERHNLETLRSDLKFIRKEENFLEGKQ